jgi:hypothetical protein
MHGPWNLHRRSASAARWSVRHFDGETAGRGTNFDDEVADHR